MLWIGVCEAVSISMIGGVVGSCLMAYAHGQTNKFNMKMMERHWRGDVDYLQTIIHELNQKVSTISVVKPVNNVQKNSNNKGYNHKRRFNQGG